MMLAAVLAGVVWGCRRWVRRWVRWCEMTDAAVAAEVALWTAFLSGDEEV